MSKTLSRKKLQYILVNTFSLALPKKLLKIVVISIYGKKEVFTLHQTITTFQYLTSKIGKEVWAKPHQLVGININEQTQLLLLETFNEQFKTEYDCITNQKNSVPFIYNINNEMFGSVDAEILYCMNTSL